MVYENIIKTLIIKNLPQFITKALCRTHLFLNRLMTVHRINKKTKI